MRRNRGNSYYKKKVQPIKSSGDLYMPTIIENYLPTKVTIQDVQHSIFMAPIRIHQATNPSVFKSPHITVNAMPSMLPEGTLTGVTMDTTAGFRDASVGYRFFKLDNGQGILPLSGLGSAPTSIYAEPRNLMLDDIGLVCSNLVSAAAGTQQVAVLTNTINYTSYKSCETKRSLIGGDSMFLILFVTCVVPRMVVRVNWSMTAFVEY